MGTAQADSLKLLSLHTVHFINICSKTSHDQTRRNYYDQKKIGIIGCGNMGGAILYGALESGVLDKENVYDINPAMMEKGIHPGELKDMVTSWRNNHRRLRGS